MRRWFYQFRFARSMRYRRKRAGLLRHMQVAMERGHATSAAREIDPADPLSWEFCAFSQNSEDGVLDYLIRRLKEPNRHFVEVGAGDGRENNTTWLAVARRYTGVMVDADPMRTDLGSRLLKEWTPYVEFRCLRVTPGNVAGLFLCNDPDVFSIDIDGGEQEMLAALFEAGKRPAIVVTEFDFREPIDGLRAFMDGHGYRFVTVESNAVNAFFLDPDRFAPEFVDALRGAESVDNVFQRNKLGED